MIRNFPDGPHSTKRQFGITELYQPQIDCSKAGKILTRARGLALPLPDGEGFGILLKSCCSGGSGVSCPSDPSAELGMTKQRGCKSRKAPIFRWRLFLISYLSGQRAYLPGPCGPSTSAAEELNCRVRNGNGCFLFAQVTRIEIGCPRGT